MMKNFSNKDLVLTGEKDQEEFFSAAFGNPKPSQKLIDATKRHKLRQMIRKKGELSE